MKNIIKLGMATALSLVCRYATADDNCVSGERYCNSVHHASSSPAYPSTSSSIDLNPAAVPIEPGLGLEAIYFPGNVPDFVLVTGTGRIGAAASLSNGEETFFGPPGFELPSDYLQRHIDQKKFISQKFALATAFGLYDNQQSGLRKVSLNLGAMAHYNRLTKSLLPGGGLNAIAGPFTFGYARARDEYLIDESSMGVPDEKLRYNSETYSVGITLTSVAIDYSLLKVTPDGFAPYKVQLLTGSLLLTRWILTAARRSEDSNRPAYDWASKTLITQQIKTEFFGGVQYAFAKRVLVGAFYNYFLLHDISVGATYFF